MANPRLTTAPPSRSARTLVSLAASARRVAGAVGARARSWAGSARRHWRRSLQLRMVTFTLIASTLLVGGFAVLVANEITNGLLHAKTASAVNVARQGEAYAYRNLDAVTRTDGDELVKTMQDVVTNQSLGLGAGVSVLLTPAANSIPILAQSSSEVVSIDQIPGDLRHVVGTKREMAHEFGELKPDNGPVRPVLIIGTPVSVLVGTFELYYVLPLDAEVASANLARTTVIITGVVLVILLALVAALLTRLVVRPVRAAARTAQRLSAGLLDQRMEVRGEDDLAVLAASFNQMATNLQRQIIRLEEMSRLQRRFTSDVSHELRTPLTTVRMAADLIYTGRDEFDPVMGRSAELLYAELNRFEELLTDLLEISRFDAGFVVLDAEPTDLVPVVRRVVERLSAVSQRAGVGVEVRVPETPVIAEVDPRRVERILRNLVGNAVEHGEGHPVVVTLASDDGAVAVTVRDYGIGLRSGEEKLVFNRFWRADPSRARQTGGTGLGLSISLEDARLHGGWLEAWGVPGAGAQFRLVLPVRSGARLTGAPLSLVPTDAVPVEFAVHHG